MLLHDVRRDARTRDGEIVLFDDQDRVLWDEEQISEGRQLLQRAIARGETGPYAVQAAIADLHLQQPRDWRQIAALYHALSTQTGSPVVELNRAIAVAELDGPEAGLAVLDGLDLDHYRYFHSARADLLRRAGRDDEARHAYQHALELAQTDAERRSLNEQLGILRPRGRPARPRPTGKSGDETPRPLALVRRVPSRAGRSHRGVVLWIFVFVSFRARRHDRLCSSAGVMRH
jgi:RNA polymerase sigma-70 factor (ECF subfamily)